MPQIIPAIVSYGVQAATASALGAIGSGIAGAIAGSLVASALQPKTKSQGPRIGDSRVQSSSYGTVLPYIQASPRVAGQVVWASEIREIATVTESGGKGGGGNENTSYTYEVDLLIEFSENELPGVDMVWFNGGLVWNKNADADNATRLASDNIPQWTSITIHTGAASQLPDPIYEAAVGAEASAFRGRLTVMFQAVQLGNSNQIPNITCQIGEPVDGVIVPDGDHPAGDGLTRLQTTFAGGVSDDISSDARGPGTIIGYGVGSVVLTDGMISANHHNPSDSDLNYIEWQGNGLGRKPVTGHTVEFFVQIVPISPLPYAGFAGDHSLAIAAVHENPTIYPMYFRWSYAGGVSNPIQFYQASGWTYSGDQVMTTLAALTHVAIVCDDSSYGDVRLYVAGNLKFTYPGTTRPRATAAPHNGRVQIGMSIGGNWAVTANYTGLRVRDAEMYTGSSFTPPASPAAWGAP